MRLESPTWLCACAGILEWKRIEANSYVFCLFNWRGSACVNITVFRFQNSTIEEQRAVIRFFAALRCSSIIKFSHALPCQLDWHITACFSALLCEGARAWTTLGALSCHSMSYYVVPKRHIHIPVYLVITTRSAFSFELP